ncbi:ABC transporter ATP-binding protein [Ketogulonicigenium vulgare]|uniref:ABC-type sugar transport system, ATPase component n=1 Tax=Ketogulonicigenium vulgare (strain WSH-001) TaxID=759362 RepID=F9Y8N0_KETVW|nr:sn-glycerol-3-phosphate ABC transporter ATP-binding protein UgpC [Ketogulonicigenium vulgare]ADO43018.1 ABC transporter related protein [Ketogulonicigenium vulgare Y25]AEM41199.1 ABC-type sugar transport system, ATPase component [Ketogulonicigenium vulgare WSH-001]ALJ81340.1 ABC transporter ATP-binding protein [Ketogulonicigenium vulgare]ANW34074.1 ABC transporter ATP-binding protein [Ketogulonicigenium vulgare]AOZ54928.1 ABC transporter [Ketogulonicigenium vulgare]
MANLTLQSVHKSYGNHPVINGVDLQVKHGEFVVFVGPSGCGKSTLLRMIAGLESITAGELRIGDEICNDVHPGDRGIAMVFQSYALYPHMSVYDNIGFNMKVNRTPKDVRDQKIRNAARILQIEHLLTRRPAQLSGGQRQRVAIGRAIVREPEVFLFDEPLSNLDAALRVDMRMELSSLHRELGATMIYVTHDQVEAMTLADKIVVMDSGTVQQVGAPIALYRRPANRFVAGFIGSPKMNFFDVQIDAVAVDSLTVSGVDIVPVRVPANTAGLQVGDQVTLGIRPQDMSIGQAGGVGGTVALVERLGSETIVSAHLSAGGKMLVALDGDASFQIGQRATFDFDPALVAVFDADGQSRFVD